MGNICNKSTLNAVDEHLQRTSSKSNKDLDTKLLSETNQTKLNQFIIKGNLGRGSFGKVYLVQSKINNNLYAMKVLNKKKIKENDLIENSKIERIILSTLTFPFMVDLFFSFQTSKRLFLVTEFIPGGDLFQLIVKLGKFSPSQIKLYAAEIVLCLNFLHENNCIYRDLKPENILLNTDGHIKLIDFGLSKMFFNMQIDKRAESICGTAEYMAPEIVTQKTYDKNVDWFSLGAILYFFHTGFPAFKCKNDPLNIEAKKQKLYFNQKIFTPECEDFIKRLVTYKPKNRLGFNGIEEILQHPYFKDMNFNSVLNKEYNPEFIPITISRHKDSLLDEENNADEVFRETNADSSSLKKNKETYDGFTYIREKLLK